MFRQAWHRPSLVGGSARSAIGDASVVMRDRRALRWWLLSARKAQVALIGALLFGWLVMAPVRDAMLHWVFPDRTVSRFFGLATRVEHNAAFRPAQNVVTALYWAGAATLVALALLLHLPAARRFADDSRSAVVLSDRNATEYATGAAPPAQPIASAHTVAHLPSTRAPSLPGASMPRQAAEDPNGAALVSGRYRLGDPLGR